MMAGLGYTLGSLQESDIGLTAQLTLAGPACNAFGLDISDFTIEVTYQSLSTLRIKIYDTANQQFTIPESVIELPVAPTTSYLGSSDPLASSLPPTPIPPSNASDPSTAFDGFPLVFVDQYLQVTSALPYGTNIYGLGEIIASSGFRCDIGTDGGIGTIQTHWNRDIQDPIDENIRYRMIGGILDFYFFSGPTDAEVISQYGSIIGYTAWQPAWGFGFHLCRRGYHNLSDDKENIRQMRAAGVSLEVQWNDIDLYHAYRDFTTDSVSFSADELCAFVQELVSIPIVDAGIAVTVNSTDVVIRPYDPFTQGVEEDVWIKNPDGSLYVGEVWPGYTFSENILSVWTEGLKNWSNMGVEFSGIWLGMNEPSSFCSYSCYNDTIWGPSGTMTINGTSTYTCAADSTTMAVTEKRGVGPGGEQSVTLNSPPYAIHNGFGGHSQHTLATNATHYGGYAELDVHNMASFLISRSTFPSSGGWSGHWLGDSYSKWRYMYPNIQGVLQNYNTYGAIPQESYRWPSVAYASRIAISARYALLPYWYTLFANASMAGLPPVKALLFEFSDEPELFTVDRQWLVGNDVLVTPVLTPGAMTVDGIFLGRGCVIWRDWYTHAVVNVASGGNTTLDAPLSHINVHIRDNSALLLHQEPGYTIYETREGPYALLVSLNAAGTAFGTAYVDDDISFPPGPSRCLTFQAAEGTLKIESKGEYAI
ncbi:hypothetical protein M405DRAFT_854975 [Rhizopogon salebrosus TDB-379]|nr:hypothetical protein M405DRAFT_854975 [Rhizopogon salebrosus TDB-379]